MRDLSYISDKEGLTAVPMTVTGECAGNALLAQKAVTMLLTNPDGYMRGGYGGGMGSMVGASNVPVAKEDMMNLAAIAASGVSGDLSVSQAGSPDTERLSRLSVSDAGMEGDSARVTFDIEPVEGAGVTVTLTPTRS